jgi:hypothetical protein
MFNLEMEIKRWSERLRKSGCSGGAEVDEFIDHLYCLIAHAETKGLTQEQAFQLALEQIGNEEELGTECFKAANSAPNRKTLLFGLTASLLVAIYLALQALISSPTIINRMDLTDAEHNFSLNWLKDVAASTREDDLLVGTMVAEYHNPSLIPQFFSRHFETLEKKRLKLSIAINHCQIDGTSDFCKTSSLETELIQLDPENLEPFLYAMAHEIDVGDEAGALDYLIQGLRTAQTNDYYLEKLTLVRNKLIDIGYPADEVNWAAETYAGHNFYAFYQHVLAVCTEQSSTKSQWVQPCMKLGRRLEEAGRTAFANVFGFAIQRDVIQASATDLENLQAVLDREKTYRQALDRAAEKLVWWSDRSLQHDFFYEELLPYGEFSAIARALERENSKQN